MQTFLKVNRRKIISNLLQFIVFIGIIAAIAFWQTRNLLSENTIAPTLNITSLSGETYIIDKKKTVIIYFFAPWCRICKFTNSNISDLYKSLDPKDYEIIPIALSWNDIDEIKKYKEKYKMPMKVFVGDKELGFKYKVESYPTFYIIKKGKIINTVVGYTTTFGLRIRAQFL